MGWIIFDHDKINALQQLPRRTQRYGWPLANRSRSS